MTKKWILQVVPCCSLRIDDIDIDNLRKAKKNLKSFQEFFSLQFLNKHAHNKECRNNRDHSYLGSEGTECEVWSILLLAVLPGSCCMILMNICFFHLQNSFIY